MARNQNSNEKAISEERAGSPLEHSEWAAVSDFYVIVTE